MSLLFPTENRTVEDFARLSARLRDAMGPHVVDILRHDLSVVLDFPGNTRSQRQWFRQLAERAQASHELHYLDVSDDICKAQLRERSKSLPPGAPFTSDDEFDAITKYFEPPSTEEGFKVVVAGNGRAASGA